MAVERVTFGAVLGVREFRTLWIADAQSMAGDQLARVALSVLVFQQTSSSALTALTYALTFLPALLGGALLSGLADRLPRRDLMFWCDMSRAVLVAAMVLPGQPLAVTAGLLVVAVLLGSPFLAAENALLPEILDGEHYVVGSGLRTVTQQGAQLVGFAAGGVVAAVIHARGALAVDAATFVISGLLIRTGLRPRPAAAMLNKGLRSYLDSIVSGARYVAGNPTLRLLLGLAWIAGLLVLPEGLAAPYAVEVGAGARATGMLLASMPAGTAIGTLIFLKTVPSEARSRWMAPLAAASGLALAGCYLRPGLVCSLILWAISGACAAYLVQVYASYARAVPDDRRGQAIGIASTGLLVSQGIGVVLGGVAAGVWSPRTTVGLAGALEALLAVLLGVAWMGLGRLERGGRHRVVQEHAFQDGTN